MTNENLKNPTQRTIANPVDLDAAIQRIQNSLTVLPWLEKSFGRARMHPDTVNTDIKRRIPKVYQEGGEYYPVMPNDALMSYSFFRVEKGRDVEDHNSNSFQMYGKTKVDNIVWVNVERISKQVTGYDIDALGIIERLINEHLKIINQSSTVTILKIWDDNPEEVFKGYTLEPNHRDLLMYPYAAWRIELNLRYEIKCE